MFIAHFGSSVHCVPLKIEILEIFSGSMGDPIIYPKCLLHILDAPRSKCLLGSVEGDPVVLSKMSTAHFGFA